MCQCIPELLRHYIYRKEGWIRCCLLHRKKKLHDLISSFTRSSILDSQGSRYSHALALVSIFRRQKKENVSSSSNKNRKRVSILISVFTDISAFISHLLHHCSRFAESANARKGLTHLWGTLVSLHYKSEKIKSEYSKRKQEWGKWKSRKCIPLSLSLLKKR